MKHAVDSLTSGKDVEIADENCFQCKRPPRPFTLSAAEVTICDEISFLFSPCFFFSCLHFFFILREEELVSCVLSTPTVLFPSKSVLNLVT